MPDLPRITYVGHATTLIEMDGKRLLTDPLLRNRVWHLLRWRSKIEHHWYQNIDAVLISHLHWDHLDLPSLRLLDETTQFIVPAGAAKLLRRHGIRHVEEISVGASSTVGGLTIQATYAAHDGNRLLSRASADSVGFLIQGEYSIYFAGDTDIFPEMADLVETLDVALLPVWGWGPTLGSGHLDPYRAAKALQLLQPRLAIPIHWGTFFPIGLAWLMPRFLIEPPQAFTLFAAALAAEVETHVLPPGSHLSLNGKL